MLSEVVLVDCASLGRVEARAARSDEFSMAGRQVIARCFREGVAGRYLIFIV